MMTYNVNAETEDADTCKNLVKTRLRWSPNLVKLVFSWFRWSASCSLSLTS